MTFSVLSVPFSCCLVKPVYWLGILCSGTQTGGENPENSIENCTAALWQRSRGILFCHLAFTAEVVDTWVLRGPEICVPALSNEYPLGLALSLSLEPR